MTQLADFTAGTISVSANGTVVTGIGTAWKTAGFREGDWFIANGWVNVVASVDSETQLTLAQQWQGGPLDDEPYRLRYMSDGSRVSAQARELINLLGGSGNLEALGGLAGIADKIPYFTGAGTMALMDRGSAGGGLIPRGSWDNGTTYAQRDLVESGGHAYASIIDDNTGNATPTTETSNAFWMYIPVAPGPHGDTGWSPVLSSMNDGDRRVFRVVDWVGGTGAKPVTGQFIGPSGLVSAIGDALDVRGPIGQPNSLAVGTVQGGATADATITGAAPSQTLNLTLPKGDKGDKGNTGDTGPAGTITGATASGLAAGAAPTVTLGGTPQARTFAFGIPKGDKGDTGYDGWTPVFAIVADGARYVQQIVDWTGGQGTKPATGQYVGASGLVSAIGDAVNIRGASGSGTGDVVGPSSAVDGELVLFDGATGKLVKGGGAPFSGSYNDLGDRPVIPAAQVPSDWNASAGVARILNKPDLGQFATTAQLTDGLGGKLDIPTGTTSQYVRGDGGLGNVGTGAGHIPVLDGSGKLPESTLPAIAIADVFEAANQAAMLALTAENGDICVRSDLNKSFILKQRPASTLANWVELRTPTDAVLSVAGKTGAVALAKGDVGLGSVDNTSDANKPVSTAQGAAINAKVTKANDTGLGGFSANSKALGNLSGSITPTHVGGNYQSGTITGATTINAPTAPGVYDLKIELLIGAGAGAVTLVGFDNTDFGEAFTTTAGDYFILQIEKGASKTIASVRKPT